jgi:recombination protein RecA
VEIYGTEASGKTTLALHAIAEAQKMGGIAAFIDAEHAMDPGYAEKLGVQLDNLVVSQPDTGEQALDIVEKLVQSGAVDLVVIDSVAALVPRSEIEGTIDDQSVGVQARLMSRAIRRLTGVVSRSNTCVIFINQIRHKIQAYGNPETTPGGLALKFAASVRLSVHARQSPIQEKGQAVGSEVTVKVVKNKLAPPYRVARFDILYGKGISRLGELIDLGLQYEVVRRSGSWYSYGDLQLGQGRENARKYLEEHPDLAQEIERKIREKAGLLPEDEGGQP